MGNCCGSKKKRKVSRKSTFTSNTQSEAKRALCELVDTERNFGLDLKYMVGNYLDPLRTEELFFDNGDLMLLNSVWLDMVEVQGRFQAKLESHTERLDDGDSKDSDLSDMIYHVGEHFIQSCVKDFGVFSKYVVVLPRVQKLVTGKADGSEKIVQFLEKIQSAQDKKDRIMTMDSILLKPFQRVMLYALILDRLGKQTEEDTVDREQIVDAIDCVRKIGEKMNDTLKKDDESGEEYKALLKHYGIAEYGSKK